MGKGMSLEVLEGWWDLPHWKPSSRSCGEGKNRKEIKMHYTIAVIGEGEVARTMRLVAISPMKRLTSDLVKVPVSKRGNHSTSDV